jgi:hypothetical protein
MNWVLLYLFVVIALAMIAPALWRQDYRLQFPCLAGLTVLFQVALPLNSLITQPDEVLPGAIIRFEVMAILCLVAAWAGYLWRRPSPQKSYFQFNEGRLRFAAFFLVLFGLFFVWKTANTVPDIDPETTQWTGPIVIYSTLAAVMRFGAILSAILFFRSRKWIFLLLALPQLIQYGDLFLIGRRSPTGEMVVVICILLFFYRKWVAPVWLMVLGAFVMALYCFNIGVFRNTVDQSLTERINAIQAADPLTALTTENMAQERRFVEVYNGANYMEARVRGGHYTYGLNYWNSFVFGFVPAQIVGPAVKNGLMIKLTDDTGMTGFEKANGTCETGVGEVFMAFGYFGCGIFFGLGIFMRWLWESARRGSILHLLILMLCTLPAVMSFSGQVWTMVNMLIHFAIFAGPWLWWSRSKKLTNGETQIR